MEETKTLAAPAHAETRVKDSRFLADAAPAQDRPAAESFVDEVRQRFPDATHHCFAYRIGLGDSAVERSSDAGEPIGTAGRPILQAIKARGLTNVVVVVTRYFGGTKLGTGGLIRAYSAAAFAALDAASVVIHIPRATLEVVVGYEHIGAVQHLIARLDGIIVAEDYGERVSLLLSVPEDQADELVEHLRSMTSGDVQIRVAGDP